MKLLMLFLTVVAATYASPDNSLLRPSGSYLPGTRGISIMSGDIGRTYSTGGDAGPGPGLHDYAGGGFPQVQKNVYFFAAPDDEPATRFRVYIAPASRRNTKIIFVKAPSYGGVTPEVIAPPSQTEDKTLVYVLVKKPQQGGSITIPSSLGVRMAKPEVYFIKYRNQAEAQRAVTGGLNGQAVGGGLSDLGNEDAFIRTLGIREGDISGGVIGENIGGSTFLEGGTRYGEPGVSGPYK